MYTDYSNPIKLFSDSPAELPEPKPPLLSKETQKVILVISCAGGLFGIVALGGGAAVSGCVALYPGIGVIGAGVLIEGGAITGVILYAVLRRQGASTELVETRWGFDNGKDLLEKHEVSFHRLIIKYKGPIDEETTTWYIKADRKKARANHSTIHPFNDLAAYRLDKEVLGLGVVPQTFWFNNKAELINQNVFPDLENHLEDIPPDCPLLVQRGVRHKEKPPKYDDEIKYISELKLDTNQAHKAFLFNLIAGRKDNHHLRIVNDAISDRCVYPIDNDQLGYPVGIKICEMYHMGANGDCKEGVYFLYDWLLLHEVADEPFSNELVEHILVIDPNDIDNLCDELREVFEIQGTFGLHVKNNLGAVQKAFQENPEITPKELFALLNPTYDYFIKNAQNNLEPVDGVFLSNQDYHQACGPLRAKNASFQLRGMTKSEWLVRK